MSMNSENKEVATKQIGSINRRGFLKTGVAAAALGVMGAISAPAKTAGAAAISLQYESAGKQWSKLRPSPKYGGATVRHAEYNDQWLGTSQLLGPVTQTREQDAGFALAFRGLLTPKAKYGIMNQGERYPLNGSLAKAIGFISADAAVGGKPNPKKLPIPDPEQMSQHIKDLGYWLKADEVGIGKMPSYGYYSVKMAPPLTALAGGFVPPETPIKDVPIIDKYPYVIVLAVEQHMETFWASTGYDGIAASQSFRCYHSSAHASIVMADYIRRLGYNARAQHFGNYEAVMAPCMIAAGMGELTRTGDTVAHPRMGFRNKVAAVITDLPLLPDKPIDFGMLDFCRVCMKCADECPSGAITYEKDPVPHNGYLRWNTDSKKCAEFRCANDEGVNCSRCIKVCPWNSKEDSWFHEAGIWFGSKGETSSKLLKAIDDMFGYGTEEITKYKWWLEWPENYKFTVPEIN